MTSPFGTQGFKLAPWQEEAVRAWEAGDSRGPLRGTLEIFTGGGKTLIALECIRRVAEEQPDLRVAIVVPMEALAHQWREMLLSRTHLSEEEVGLLGAGRKAELQGVRVLVAVLNTASKVLPDMARDVPTLMLVVDECHRAGAPTFSRVLKAPAIARLGLSATPDREEFDESGEPLVFDEQVVGQELGSVVYRFGLREARRVQWLPDYEIQHHAVELNEEEVRRYEMFTQRVDDAADKLRGFGIDTSRARAFASKNDEAGKLAQAWISATSLRKDLLYRAFERERVARTIVRRALAEKVAPRILLFHERVNEAVALFKGLELELATTGEVNRARSPVVLEHSRLPTKQRKAALDAFRSGESPILVSVKSLVEGLDVPEADIGVSVASSSSVRQRIQSLGRVLRRSFAESSDVAKRAEMHIIYVADTVDESIYAKEDWSDLTGADANTYWLWKREAELPVRLEGPPQTPRPTEEQEWERLGGRAPLRPEPWLGVLPQNEYSVDTKGNVTNALGTVIANPQKVADMVEAVRGRPGGRFMVTPEHRLVIVMRESGGEMSPVVAGALDEPFEARELPTGSESAFDTTQLDPGDLYPGPATKERGSYRFRQKRGGLIERSASKRTTEFALTEGADRRLVENAHRLLDAWRKVSSSGFQFHVNKLWHAWYLEGGEPRFLAGIPGGLAWPSETGEEAG